MSERMTKRQFVLNTLLPYKENPETCGYDRIKDVCQYLTNNGRRCAVGKYMKEGKWQTEALTFDSLLRNGYKKEDFLNDEALEQNLSNDQWVLIQFYHDELSRYQFNSRINQIVDKLEKSFKCKFTKLRF